MAPTSTPTGPPAADASLLSRARRGAILRRPVAGPSATPRGRATAPRARSCSSQKCGSCHTLADAGTNGKIGPNLDYAFAESRRERARREHDRPGRPGPDRLPDHGPVDRSARHAGRHRQGPGRRGCRELRRERRRDRRQADAGRPRRPTPTPTHADARDRHGRRRRRRSRRQGRLRDSGLRRLPHARRRGRDGQRRPEPRRGQARRRARDERVTNGQGAMPLVQGTARRRRRSPTSRRYVSSVAGK